MQLGMDTISQSVAVALGLVAHLDPRLTEIVRLSLAVSLTATLISAAIGLPLGAAIAIGRFPGREPLIVILNAAMGLPPVVVGLFVYLLLSRAGPLGELGLLFTPPAMVIAQTVLIVPIVAALTRQFIEDAWIEYREQLASLRSSWLQSTLTLLWDTRWSLLTVLLAGFGRAAAEVGAVIIVGGNIDGVTRVMTTAIALETSKGDLPLALALGVVLITLVMALNVGAHVARRCHSRRDARARCARCHDRAAVTHVHPGRQRRGQKHAAARAARIDRADTRPRDLGTFGNPPARAGDGVSASGAAATLGRGQPAPRIGARRHPRPRSATPRRPCAAKRATRSDGGSACTRAFRRRAAAPRTGACVGAGAGGAVSRRADGEPRPAVDARGRGDRERDPGDRNDDRDDDASPRAGEAPGRQHRPVA